jgi:hypothetical protein
MATPTHPWEPDLLTRYPLDLIATVYNHHFASFVADLATLLLHPLAAAQQEQEHESTLAEEAIRLSGDPAAGVALVEIAMAVILFLAQQDMVACLQVSQVT